MRLYEATTPKDTIMNTTTVIAAALFSALAAFGGSAAAAPSGTAAAKPVTRAEVLADLAIYRESGLAVAELSENIGQDTQAKHAELRSSPRYGGSTESVDVAAAR